MNPIIIAIVIAAYFSMLIVISLLTGKQNDNDTFFLGNRKSSWYMVAIAMIGASLSGVTFISVPGWVSSTGFTYMQMVLGFLLGYFLIANILLPLFYRLNLTSIYSYLDTRFGTYTYQTGSLLFIVSKAVGAAARLYLMASVLQYTLFDSIHIPFAVTTIVTIGLIWLYTFRGGVKTIIWTDAIQALLMISAVILTFIIIVQSLNLSFMDAIRLISKSEHARIFEFSDWGDKQHFWKQFIAGAFITLGMTGLDQDMMQKNLTCKSLSEAKKNMYWYSFAFIPVNLIFLALGALLYIFASQHHIQASGDHLFPEIATGGYLPPVVGILFLLGLVAAAYSSADSALASLTTAFSIDILKVNRLQEKKALKYRQLTHIGFSLLLCAIILIIRQFNLETIINTIYTLAGYTYGPLLGLFIYGLFTKFSPRDQWVPLIALTSPVLTGILDFHAKTWFGFELGHEKLILNTVFTLIGLSLISIKKDR